jgi:hypothetical protein
MTAAGIGVRAAGRTCAMGGSCVKKTLALAAPPPTALLSAGYVFAKLLQVVATPGVGVRATRRTDAVATVSVIHSLAIPAPSPSCLQVLRVG